MNLYDTHTMKRGAILVDVCGYTGEEDFYAMHKIILIKTVFLSVPAVKALMTT